MSVFTPVSLDEARAFVAAYAVGDVIDFQDIAAGVENSNFFVTTTQGRYVLTLFEKIPRADLDFYIGLMSHLYRGHVPCAEPVAARDGVTIRHLNGKPAVLVARLEGNDIAHPDESACFAVGVALANLHQTARSFALKMANWRGLSWWQQYAAALAEHLQDDESRLLNAELHHQSGFDGLGLPRGIIHGDLFRDNVLWRSLGETRIPQMIDFYFACEEQMLLDIAITVNDWCLDFERYPKASLQPARTRALLAGYHGVRPLENAEREAWPQVLRAAALRSWLGRLGYHYFPRDSTLTHPKDHAFSQRLLEFHIEAEADNRQLLPD